MKWYVVICLVTARFTGGNVLRCSSDSTCISENQDRVSPLKKADLPSGKYCAPGTSWKNDCNTCYCVSNGWAQCTQIGCPQTTVSHHLRCAPGSMWRNECNTCQCSPDGQPVCTKKDCARSPDGLDPVDFEPEAPADLPSGKDCAPGTSWKNDCNTCYCGSYGRAQCTLIGCPQTTAFHDLRCAPGSMWKNECNTCQCSPDGQPVCTKKACARSPDGLDPVDFEPEAPEHIPDKKETEVQRNRIDTDHKIHKRTVCKPNQEFQSECNSCKCAADGQGYSCTHNECLDRDMTKEVEVFMESEGVDHIERHSVCKARETFPIGCNTCHCNLDGTDYSCTNKPCPLPDDVEFFHEPKTSSKNKTVVCEANRSFKKDCNTCWCNEDGTSFFCTRRACVSDLPDEGDDDKPEELRIIKKECRPNEVFELECNMCRCNPDGKSFSCTRRACLEQVEDFKINISTSLSRKARASQEPQKTCQPGTEFRMDCNKCLCDNEGQDFSCTRIDCNALNNNNNGGVRTKRDAAERVPAEGCTPGSVFERRCNVCRCTEVGYALCTTNKCQEKDATDKPTTEVPGPAVDANFRCNPGEQYNFDCNDCTCSADGKSIFCTLRFCDKSLTPD